MRDLDIIVIAYNEERRISETLKSIVNQNTKYKFRVILVDDGSADKTVEFAKKIFLTEKIEFEIIENSKNYGRGTSRQIGIDNSNAKYIGFVDADIILPVYWVDKIIDELEVKNYDGLSMAARPDGDVAVIARIFKCPTKINPGSAGITGNNVIFKKEIFELFGFSKSARLGEDFRLAYTLEREGYLLKTLLDGFVEHKEAKSYKKALRWLFDSGVDATSLLFEFKKIRVPDLASFIFIASLCSIFLGIKFFFIPIIVILAISFLHAYTRFSLKGREKFLYTYLADIPLMFLYLIGRLVGVIKLFKNILTIKKK